MTATDPAARRAALQDQQAQHRPAVQQLLDRAADRIRPTGSVPVTTNDGATDE